jgi:hypothetical protein
MGKSNLLYYVLAVLFGLSAGFVEVQLNDLLATALVIMICTMVLGAARPQHALKWVVIVGVCVPAIRAVTYFMLGEQVYRAQIWESALAFVVAAVGTYTGVFARRAVTELFGPDRAQGK